MPLLTERGLNQYYQINQTIQKEESHGNKIKEAVK